MNWQEIQVLFGVVDVQLPKLDVVGSNPIARSYVSPAER
jgi:hypothetical protein